MEKKCVNKLSGREERKGIPSTYSLPELNLLQWLSLRGFVEFPV